MQAYESNPPQTLPSLFKPVILLGLLILSGCANQMNPVGEAKFDCNRRQDAKSPHCRSFKSVDAATGGELPDSRFDKSFNIKELDKLNGIAPDLVIQKEDGADQKIRTPAVVLPHQRRSEPALVGAPVREGPVIQRVWVKRFVDGRDVLTENTVVYREIKPTRWAGFDTRTTAASAEAKSYPRRPIEQAAPSSASAQAPANPRAPEFSQPSTSEASESATDPAVSGFNNSMPK